MNQTGTVNILFCGTGGQGVLTAAEICGWAALYEGFHVKKSEVHGMAQRGGSVESHLRFGKQVFSPLIPQGQADYLVAFDNDENERLRPFLKKGGKELFSFVQRAQSADLSDKRYINTYILGLFSRELMISEGSWLKAISLVFAGKNEEENKKVFSQARRQEV
jgi:indolepyruvate ferredoxin oxidoreductase, beta subunit